MPQLITPTVDVHASFLAAMGEFQAEGGDGPDDESLTGRWFLGWADRWADSAVFASFVEQLRADAMEHSRRPAGHVPSTTLWWTEGAEYLGRLTIRHRLTERLLEIGGHIGYDVRPTARRRGHATAMLAAALPVARSLGIDPALITCDSDNLGSRKVIEANGGVLEDERNGKLRFWTPTSLVLQQRLVACEAAGPCRQHASPAVGGRLPSLPLHSAPDQVPRHPMPWLASADKLVLVAAIEPWAWCAAQPRAGVGGERARDIGCDPVHDESAYARYLG